jgi:hypothetical protein
MAVLKQIRQLSRTRNGTDLQRAFKRFDVDGNRQLTVRELYEALNSLGVKTGAWHCAHSLAHSTLRLPSFAAFNQSRSLVQTSGERSACWRHLT